MKMVMRVQKAQVPAVYKWTQPGAGSWNKALAELAGYTKFSVCMIGAAAGKSGDAAGPDATRDIVNGAGGGGGGMLYIRNRLLSTLTLDTNFTVGAAGRHGVDSKNNVKAENGISGGQSSFDGFAAYGGRPPIGGKINRTGPNTVTYDPSLGGDGGGNSLNLYTEIGQGGSQSGNNMPTAPTIGQIGGNGVDLGAGGGGGGVGRARTNNDTLWGAQEGADGNGGFSAFTAPGGAVSSSKGGAGGGADLRGALEAEDPHEYYGSYASGSIPDGVVLLQLS